MPLDTRKEEGPPSLESIIEEVSAIEIPRKSSLKSAEVCQLTSVRPYVLRYWEEEFSIITPLTNSHGQKVYGPEDVEAIFLVKKLLFENKLTVEQVKKKLSDLLDGRGPFDLNLLKEKLAAGESPLVPEESLASDIYERLQNIYQRLGKLEKQIITKLGSSYRIGEENHHILN